MRITLALGTLQVGGTERQACRLATELKERGHEVQVLVVTGTGPLEAALREAGIEPVVVDFHGFVVRDQRGRLRPWRAVGELAKLARVWRALRSFRPDVCHAFLFYAYAFVIPIAAMARVPVRLSGRRGLSRQPPRGRWVFDALERLANRASHGAVANSQAVAEVTTRLDGVPAERVHVIANGVDRPDDAADPTHHPPVGVMVANLIAYKGHLDLVEALARLDRPPAVRCLGAGPARPETESAIEAAGLTEVMRLEGATADVPAVLRQVQFAVQPSHEESFPNAVLEAMAAGLPVVATRVGGVPDLVTDGVHGFVIEPRDPAALAGALEKLASDPDLRERMGAAARQRTTDFSWAACVDAHLSLYSSLHRDGRPDAG